MRADLLPHLACPDCRSGLTSPSKSEAPPDFVDRLACIACSREFPVENGIVSLMPRSLLPQQHSEMTARDAQVADYDAMWYLSLFGAVEIPMTLGRLDVQSTDTVLEAGCGTGRMTRQVAARAGRLVSIDFSLESLRANAAKLRAQEITNVDLIQADLCHLPFQPGVFDRILSCQVLEHVPGDDARRAAVAGLGRCARPGAGVVVSAYRHSIFAREKQGSHDGGIPFFRFSEAEFRDLLSTAFNVESVTGALVYIHLARCTRGPGDPASTFRSRLGEGRGEDSETSSTQST